MSAGRSWLNIERAGAKALQSGKAPRCRYHVGTEMLQIKLKRPKNTTTGMVRHEGTVTAFRCPIVGCQCVSGRSVVEDNDDQ